MQIQDGEEEKEHKKGFRNVAYRFLALKNSQLKDMPK